MSYSHLFESNVYILMFSKRLMDFEECAVIGHEGTMVISDWSQEQVRCYTVNQATLFSKLVKQQL